MLILSLFPGLGLLDRAFEEAGFTVVRGPDVLWGGDVRIFHPPSGVFDGVIGGPPCQTFSTLANLVRAKGHEPRFGNLIPEFERCVREARPQWFLMENVPDAPVPAVSGDYGAHNFILCNSWLDAGDGLGEEQERKRRFSFGMLASSPIDLRRWIQPAALVLPKAEGAVRAGSGLGPTSDYQRSRVQAVTHRPEAVPVAIGGSGKVKRTRQPPVSGHDGIPPVARSIRERQSAITGAHQCSHRPKGGRGERRSLAEMCRLQGLPEDFLADAPFTMEGKRKAVANGVPLPMGRAVAAAVLTAVSEAKRPIKAVV